MKPDVVPMEGEPFTFTVASRSRPSAPHRVELDANNWKGECSCERFRYKKDRCPHITAALIFAALTWGPMLAKELTKRK